MGENHKKISNSVWNIANLLRGSWKSYEYQDVILPFLVLKRLDMALAPTKQKVISRFNDLDGRAKNLDILKRESGYDFYNTSPFDFKKLIEDPQGLEKNLRRYIDSFSPNIKDIFEKLNFDVILEKLAGGEKLLLIMKEFNKLDISPDKVSNYEMGLTFEDLIRRFAEQSNETAGEHYTPRDVVSLMAMLLFAGEEDELRKKGVTRTLYDPAAGTGGMLTEGKDYVLKYLNKEADIFLFGQELNPKTYAICKADMLMKGEDVTRIKGGEKEHSIASTLSNDQHKGMSFDYIISNPPYGVEWKNDEKKIKDEHERGSVGRFKAGLPAISDGQFLFLQHAISKFNPTPQGGSDAVIITNGSPLFTGDAGSGPSEIRRWMFENDYIKAIIALPDKLFFNTGIPTYVWLFSNRKEEDRKGKVQLIDARDYKHQLRKNLGEKRYEIKNESAQEIASLYDQFHDSEKSKIFPTTEFAYRAVTVQRPLQINFQVTEERIERIKLSSMFVGPVVKDDDKKEEQEKKMRKQKEAEENLQEFEQTIVPVLNSFDDKLYKNREEFLKDFEEKFNEGDIKLSNQLKKAILAGLSERDETADICTDKKGNPEPDKDLKDIERIPFGKDIYEYFEEEVKPYVPDAWIDEKVVDEKDGQIGKVGYEIPFTRYFYKYEPPRPVEEIEKEIKDIEEEIQEILKEI
jgi:type I restriction enzyme M protein